MKNPLNSAEQATEKFHINEVVWDSHAKELVKITNGIEQDGIFFPTEAIALRVVGPNIGKLQIAWTYRKVNKEDLRKTHTEREKDFNSLLNPEEFNDFKFRGAIQIGRI
jgi:hypothetical protein